MREYDSLTYEYKSEFYMNKYIDSYDGIPLLLIKSSCTIGTKLKTPPKCSKNNKGEKTILMSYVIAISLEFSLCLLNREAYQQSMHET